MTRSRFVGLAAGALLLCVAGAALANPLWPGYFELLDRPYGLAIPDTGARWESVSGIAPADSYLVTVVQESYIDNSDGVVSVGDRVWGAGGLSWPQIAVAAVRPLFRLDENGWLLIPETPAPGSPVGQTWLVLRPAEHWGEPLEVQAWTPAGGGGFPEAGDSVLLNGTWHVLRDVHLGIEGDFGVPVKTTTWGRIKQRVRRIL